MDTTTLLFPWISPEGYTSERHSMQTFVGDGTNGPFEFNFSGGYLDPAHIKAYRFDPYAYKLSTMAVTLLGPNQAQFDETVPVGHYAVLYRDTPKDLPLVDYTEGAVLDEKNLETANQQAVFAVAEVMDRIDAAVLTNNIATGTSQAALDTANGAWQQADMARMEAAWAMTWASAAENSAGAAVATANEALATANAIDGKAQTALDSAIVAVNTAYAASATANGIDAKATQAQADAAAALDAANAAAGITTGTIEAAVADAVTDALADKADVGHTHPWADVSGKPEQATRWPAWGEVSDKPSAFAPIAHTHTAADISDASTVGRDVLTATSATNARAAIGAGTGNSNVELGHAAHQAKPGNWQPDLATGDTTGQLPWSRLSGVPDSVGAPALPQALGVGSYILGSRSLNWGAGANTPGALYTASQVRYAHLSIFVSNMGDWDSSTPSISGYNPEAGLSGTWRSMSSIPQTHPSSMNQHLTLFLRIA